MKIDPLKAKLNSFAIRSFRTTADRDYVHARLAYRSNLFPQFQWSALHCLEKYAKCVLLLNRVKGKKFRHEVRRPIEKFNRDAKFDIELSQQTYDFIDRLEDGAQFRYLEVSWYNNGHDLVKLDRAVFELRRYCQILDYSIESKGKTIDLLNANLQRLNAIERPWGKNERFSDGWIEKVLKKKDHPAREALIWKNLWFSASTRKKISLTRSLEAENAPLYLHPEILDEVTKFVFLPKEVINGYKEEANKS